MSAADISAKLATLANAELGSFCRMSRGGCLILLKASCRSALIYAFRLSVHSNYSLTFRKRKALLMTETELRLIAAPAIIGLSNQPKKG